MMFNFDSDDLDWIYGELRAAAVRAERENRLLIDYAPELVAAALSFFYKWRSEGRHLPGNTYRTMLSKEYQPISAEDVLEAAEVE